MQEGLVSWHTWLLYVHPININRITFMAAQSDLSEARPIYPPKIIKLERFALQKPVKVGEVGEKALILIESRVLHISESRRRGKSNAQNHTNF